MSNGYIVKNIEKLYPWQYFLNLPGFDLGPAAISARIDRGAGNE